jgi:hypothetical protein
MGARMFLALIRRLRHRRLATCRREDRLMLNFETTVLGAADVRRAVGFWSRALGCDLITRTRLTR